LKKNPMRSPAEREAAQRTQKTMPIWWISPPVRMRLPTTQNIVEPQRSLRNFVDSMRRGSVFLLEFLFMTKPKVRPRGQTSEQKERGFISVITIAATMSAARASPSSGTNIPPKAMVNTNRVDKRGMAIDVFTRVLVLFIKL
jgi:hypothetical protein